MSELAPAVRKVRGGDPEAFRVIVEATAAPMLRLAARITGNRAEGEDVLQDAYVKAYRAILGGGFDGRSKVETWLYRIVANAALDYVRSRRAQRLTCAEPAVIVQDLPRAESALALMELGDWLSVLPAEQRTVLVLKAVEGRTSAEIAELLGCSEGAVEQRLFRARSALRAKGKRVGNDG